MALFTFIVRGVCVTREVSSFDGVARTRAEQDSVEFGLIAMRDNFADLVVEDGGLEAEEPHGGELTVQEVVVVVV